MASLSSDNPEGLKIGDCVRSTVSQNGCQKGTIVKFSSNPDLIEGLGSMVQWEHGEVCYSPLSELELNRPAKLSDTTEERATPEQIEEARSCYGSDEIEIDDDARCVETPHGVWVQAWVWLDTDEQEE